MGRFSGGLGRLTRACLIETDMRQGDGLHLARDCAKSAQCIVKAHSLLEHLCQLVN